MKYYELTKEEEQLLSDFEAGEFKRVPNLQKKKRFQRIAKATLEKTRQINIRLSERDVHKLKARAAEKGIPYQTLITSVLHQYGNQ